jgi:peptidoglycan hydrolase CwlO-like protein
MKKAFENIPLAIVMTLISAATSFAIVQTKVNNLEKTADKNETTLNDIKDFKAEQRAINTSLKEDIGEVKSDIKELLMEIRSLK